MRIYLRIQAQKSIYSRLLSSGKSAREGTAKSRIRCIISDKENIAVDNELRRRDLEIQELLKEQPKRMLVRTKVL